MIGKPLAILNKFSGMSSMGGMFWMDGFRVRNENGLSMLDEYYWGGEQFSSETTNFSSLQNITGMVTTKGNAENYRIFSDGQNFFCRSISGYNGKIHSQSGTLTAFGTGGAGDIKRLASGNFIYTNITNLGMAYTGRIATGSSTTKIIDYAGRNFTTLGIIVGDADRNKVTNLTTGVEYTVTSITTTNSTNDTLNFTAVGSNDNISGKDFIIFIDTKFTFDTPTQFIGQPERAYWSRQIKQYGSDYFITNGNWLSKLGADETTFVDKYRQLPATYQSICFEVNQGNMLISAIIADNKSYLLLWTGDSSTPDYQAITETPRPTVSLNVYGTNFCYVTNGTLFYTDGYQSKSLSSLTGDYTLGDLPQPRTFNGLLSYNNQIIFAEPSDYSERYRSGVYVYDPSFGWSFSRCLYAGQQLATPYNVFLDNSYDNPFSSSIRPDIGIGCSRSYNVLQNQGLISPKYSKSFIYLMDFKNPIQIKEIQLSLSEALTEMISDGTEKVCDIEVNIGEVKAPLMFRAQSTSNSVNMVTINNSSGNYNNIKEGDEIIFLDGTCRGERTFIQSISGQGTAIQQMIVSPVLSAVNASFSNIMVQKLRNVDRLTVTQDKLNEPARFIGNFYGDKMWLEVVIYGRSTAPYAFPVSINDIKIY